MTDLLSHGGDDERPPWRPPRWTLSVAVVVVVGALVAGLSVVVGGKDGRPHAAASASPSPASGPDLPVLQAAPRDAVALLLPGDENLLLATGDWHDPGVRDGPWTVTVRRPDGSLGRHGAVVTFPAPALTSGYSTRVGHSIGRVDGNVVTWPVAGSYARVRGDLATSELITIAASTEVRGHRPVVRTPSGLEVVASGPYRSADVTQARYGFRGQDGVGGLVTMGMITGGGFEDALYGGVLAHAATTVRGRPAIVSPDYGGNFAIAWEVRRGVVAYIGNSGSTLSSTAVAALRRVAGDAVLVDRPRWLATGPEEMTSINDFRAS